MGRRHILTSKDIEKCLYEGNNVLFITKDTIILPGAQDLLKTTNIKLVRYDNDDELKRYLKERFAITDEKVCDKIVKTIRELITRKEGQKTKETELEG